MVLTGFAGKLRRFAQYFVRMASQACGFSWPLKIVGSHGFSWPLMGSHGLSWIMGWTEKPLVVSQSSREINIGSLRKRRPQKNAKWRLRMWSFSKIAATTRAVQWYRTSLFYMYRPSARQEFANSAKGTKFILRIIRRQYQHQIAPSEWCSHTLGIKNAFSYTKLKHGISEFWPFYEIYRELKVPP